MELAHASDKGALSIAIVVPCLNEELSLECLAQAITDEFAGKPYEVTVLLVDDGSTDGTWDKVNSIAANVGPVHFGGLRLQRNRGKLVAQAVGLQESLTRDVVVFMDADGQHSVGSIPELIECSRLSKLPCIARRSKYERRLTSVVGTAALTVASWMVGSRFDPRDSEFVAVPAEQCREMARNPQLGITPLLPIVYETGEVTHLDIEVLPGFDDNRNSRWSVSSLWHKGLVQLLSDPWVALPRIAALVAAAILLVAIYGLAVGVQSVLAGTFLGIGSVIVIQSVILAVIGSLLLMVLGLIVILLRSMTYRSLPDLVVETTTVDSSRDTDGKQAYED